MTGESCAPPPASGVGLRLSELARELRTPSVIIGQGDVRVTGMRHDSRQVVAGDVFVVRLGQHADGSQFVLEAARRGAVAILAARSHASLDSAGLPLVLVDDVPSALAFGAAATYGHPGFSLDVIGITGTNGKTTLTHLVRGAVDAADGTSSCATMGTVGVAFRGVHSPATHTTPEADDIARSFAQLRAQGATHVAMEVSSHALVQGRVLGVRFHVAAFTNLTQDHLDYHGDMGKYGEAKAKLFRDLAPATSVINVDDAFGAALSKTISSPVLRVSCDETTFGAAADVRVRHCRQSIQGIVATMDTPRGAVEVVSPLIGAHNVQNLAVTVGVCCALDVDLTRAVAGLRLEMGAPGRMQRCETPADDIAVIVDYAHTPDALSRILDAVRGVTIGRVICVFGCGGDRDPSKRPIMGREAGTRSDVCIVTNDNPRSESPQTIAESIVLGVEASGQRCVSAAAVRSTQRGFLVELDRDAAIRLAVLSAAPGDLVLIAGKGHETYQIVGDTKSRFSDVEHAVEALRARRAGGGA